jgi:hypothetical protein
MHRFLIAVVTVFVASSIAPPVWAQKPVSTPSRATRPALSPRARASVIPGTPESAFTRIQGNALNSTDGPLPNSVVRLRDVRLGHIVDSQVTDRSGLFEFRSVDPGSYVVELMGDDQTILAASQLLNINAGEALSAVVKLPFRVPPFAGLLGHSAPQAATVISAAAAAGVLATQVTVDAVSPR